MPFALLVFVALLKPRNNTKTSIAGSIVVFVNRP